jgi:hypothetical protein
MSDRETAANRHDITMFYGAASGQQRSALRRLDPEAVMISHATARNKPWEDEYRLFVDSGGYHHMVAGDGAYASSDEEYLIYLLKHRPALYALRDYPCEPDLLRSLGRTVREQQERTTDHHRQLLDKVDGHNLADNAVSVIQGWTLDQYLSHLDELRDHGLLTPTMAIGTICRRGYDAEIAEIVMAVREALPSWVNLHAFGVKSSVLRFREVVEALDSVDSAAYDYSESRVPSSRADGESFTWRDCARAYLNWRHDLMQTIGSESLHGCATQTTLAMADGGTE